MHQLLRTRVNDFALKLANVNGTGSASANSLLMQAIFRMGIPVSGKNLFPSNIQGLPTWYEIRVNKDGYTARALDYDLMVAMNSQTYAQDVAEVREGGYLLYDSTWPLDPKLIREDVNYLGVPFSKMCNETFKESRERILMKNIAYAGHAGGAARCRHGGGRAASRRKVLRQESHARIEHQGPAPGLRLRQRAFAVSAAVSSGEDERQRRQDPDRRQHRGRPRLRLCRRDRRRLVSHHAVHILHGCLQGILREVSQGSRDRRKQLLHPAGRRRTGRHRHGDRSVLERSARVHLHLRPRHLAHERTAGPGVLRRDSGRHRRCAARRSVHRHADAHPAGRSDGSRLRLAWRHQTYSAVSVESGRMFRVRAQGFRSRGALSDSGVSDDGSRYRHERLGGAAPHLGRHLRARSRPRVESGASSARSPNSSAIIPRTRTSSRRARCPASTPKARSSRAAPVTTNLAATPKRPPSIRKWSTACSRSTRPPRNSCPRR